MKTYLKRIDEQRHEAMAGTFAVLSVLWLLKMFLIAGHVSGPASTIVQAGPPPSLGVWNKEANTTDSLARAGESAAEVQPQPQSQSGNSEDQNSQQQGAASESQNQSSDNASIGQPPVAVAGITPANDSPTQQNQDTTQANAATAAKADSAEATKRIATLESGALEPNEVEDAPEPVEEMSPEEIQQAVDAYIGWIHRGRVTLKVEYSRLSATQLNSVVSLYVLCSDNGMLRIKPTGAYEVSTEVTVSKGLWVGDLPRGKNDWPASVSEQARLTFGKHYKLTSANFFWSEECMLKLFRHLAKGIGKDNEPGKIVVLQLLPGPQNQIHVELLN